MLMLSNNSKSWAVPSNCTKSISSQNGNVFKLPPARNELPQKKICNRSRYKRELDVVEQPATPSSPEIPTSNYSNMQQNETATNFHSINVKVEIPRIELKIDQDMSEIEAIDFDDDVIDDIAIISESIFQTDLPIKSEPITEMNVETKIEWNDEYTAKLTDDISTEFSEELTAEFSEELTAEFPDELTVEFSDDDETVTESTAERTYELTTELKEEPEMENPLDVLCAQLRSLKTERNYENGSTSDEGTAVDNFNVDCEPLIPLATNESVELNRPLRESFANIFEKLRIENNTDDDAISLFADAEELNEFMDAEDPFVQAGHDSNLEQEIPQSGANENQENESKTDLSWLAMSKLQTDDDRYRVIRLRWKNLVIPNPNRNLTTHNFWARRIAASVSEPGKRKRAEEESEMPPPKKTRSCVEHFDKTIEKLRQEVEVGKRNLNIVYHTRKRMLDEELEKQVNAANSRYMVAQEKLGKHRALQQAHAECTALREEYNFAISTLKNLYEKSVDENSKSLQNQIEKLEKFKEEVFNFRKFYSGLKNSSTADVDTTLILEEVYGEIEEREEIFQKFDQSYCD